MGSCFYFDKRVNLIMLLNKYKCWCEPNESGTNQFQNILASLPRVPMDNNYVDTSNFNL